jgi:hypothetical protein
MRPGLLAAGPAPRTGELDGDTVRDLELATLAAAMAGDDEQARTAIDAVLRAPLLDVVDVRHRQDVLAEVRRHRRLVTDLHEVAVAAAAGERAVGRSAYTVSGEPLLHRSVRVLRAMTDPLRRARRLTRAEFASAGFRGLAATLATFDDTYLRELDETLAALRCDDGIVATAALGPGNKGVGFVLHEPPGRRTGVPPALRRSRLRHVASDAPAATDGFWSEARGLAALRGRVLADVTAPVAAAAAHLTGFFVELRDELAFMLGCLRLADRLDGIGVPLCRPEALAAGSAGPTACGLVEPCLALLTGRPVVGSDLDVDGCDLVVVTGPNQGGKSTFLRGVGVAQVMLQAGMPVAAQAFTAPLVSGVHTHWTAAEDATFTSGRLDEELARIAAIADRARPHALLLCNESFASTDEREGSALAAEAVRGFTDADVRVLVVTHLHEFARRMLLERPERTLFLRAQRCADGTRTFAIVPGAPEPTAHGTDLYDRMVAHRSR